MYIYKIIFSFSRVAGAMSCIRAQDEYFPPPPPSIAGDHVTMVPDGGGAVNGLTATSVGETVPPDSPQQRAPLKPALGHIDFWPSCQTRALRACDATFETFE